MKRVSDFSNSASHSMTHWQESLVKQQDQKGRSCRFREHAAVNGREARREGKWSSSRREEMT